MLDFDSPLDIAKNRETTTVNKPLPQVVERVTVVPVTEAAGYLAKQPEQWNWTDLRDYVTTQIEQRHGPQVRDPKKEAGIFKGFMSRWGAQQAVLIARAAFTVHDGMWRTAPISVTRFCAASDPYFASIIAKNLS